MSDKIQKAREALRELRKSLHGAEEHAFDAACLALDEAEANAKRVAELVRVLDAPDLCRVCGWSKRYNGGHSRTCPVRAALAPATPEAKPAEPAKCPDGHLPGTCDFYKPPPTPEAAPVEFANRCETCQGVMPLCADCCADLRAQLAAAQARVKELEAERMAFIEQRDKDCSALGRLHREANARADKAEKWAKHLESEWNALVTERNAAIRERDECRNMLVQSIVYQDEVDVARRTLAEAVELVRALVKGPAGDAAHWEAGNRASAFLAHLKETP